MNENTNQATQKFVLIGDDDTFFRKIVSHKLKKAGYEVVSCENGSEVLSLAKERKPNLILLDLIMPVKDGFTTLAELKSDPALSDIPVVVLSSLEQAEDIQKITNLGAAGHHPKENFNTLLTIVQKFL